MLLIPELALARTREAMHNSWDKNDPKDARVILQLLKTGLAQTWHDPPVNAINDVQELPKTHFQVRLARVRVWHTPRNHYSRCISRRLIAADLSPKFGPAASRETDLRDPAKAGLTGSCYTPQIQLSDSSFRLGSFSASAVFGVGGAVACHWVANTSGGQSWSTLCGRT